MLNGPGKGVTRGRLTRDKALLFWQEVQSLPVRVADVAVNETLLELALKHNLAVYDDCYLSLTQARRLPLATVDGKLQQASVLRHSRLATTTDVYMREIPESVKATVAAINKELRLKPARAEAS